LVNLQINSYLLKDIDLVIFDKDGTLMNLYHYWSSMVNYRVEFVKQKLGFSEEQKKEIMFILGIDLDNKRMNRDGPVGNKKREVVMQVMENALSALGFTGIHDLCFEAFMEADRISLKTLPEIIKPVKGIKELINSLHKRACHIAVATSDIAKRAQLAVELLEISDKVDIVVGCDMVNKHKPHPQMINFILKKLSLNKENTVMVGDALVDIEMGNHAGLKASIAVTGGIALPELFLGKTEYIVQDISQIRVI